MTFVRDSGQSISLVSTPIGGILYDIYIYILPDRMLFHGLFRGGLTPVVLNRV